MLLVDKMRKIQGMHMLNLHWCLGGLILSDYSHSQENRCTPKKERFCVERYDRERQNGPGSSNMSASPSPNGAPW